MTYTPPSDDIPVVALIFKVRNGGATYLDGIFTSRMFIDKQNMETELNQYIENGRLTLDKEGEIKPTLISLTGRGGIYTAVLENPQPDHEPSTRPFISREPQKPQMNPVINYDQERQALRIIEENRFYDFLELLKNYSPMVKERTVTEFDGKTIHPISTRTLLSEMKVYSRGLEPQRKKEARTLILLDRSLSMGNPWSLWEEYSKIKIASFLAKAIHHSQTNSALFTFGSSLKKIQDITGLVPDDETTRLDIALNDLFLYDPERLVVLTDGKPVYIEGQDTEELSTKTIDNFDTLGRSGVHTLIILLGRNEEMASFYRRLDETPQTTLIHLRAGGDIVRMMHKLSRWL